MITYVAIERSIENRNISRETSDRYDHFAKIFHGRKHVGYLYPPMRGEGDLIGVNFITREADFSDIRNPIGCEVATLSISPAFLTNSLTKLAGMLPPF